LGLTADVTSARKENVMSSVIYQERWHYLWDMDEATWTEDQSLDGAFCPDDRSVLWAVVGSEVDGVAQQAACLSCRKVFGLRNGHQAVRPMCMWHPPHAERAFHCQKHAGHGGPHRIGGRDYIEVKDANTRTDVRTEGDNVSKRKPAKRNRLTDLRCAWKHATDDEKTAFLAEVLPKLECIERLVNRIESAWAVAALIKEGEIR
jgi:hypothetical protein